MSDDILIKVRRQPSDYRIATYKQSGISDIDWDNISGGIRSSFMGQYVLYGYVMCNEAIDGEIAHSGQYGIENHGPCPHRIKVCILKQDNEKEYANLLEDLPPKPEITFLGPIPKSYSTFKEDIESILSENGEMREADLIKALQASGFDKANSKAVLRNLAIKWMLIHGRDSKDKRFSTFKLNLC